MTVVGSFASEIAGMEAALLKMVGNLCSDLTCHSLSYFSAQAILCSNKHWEDNDRPKWISL